MTCRGPSGLFKVINSLKYIQAFLTALIMRKRPPHNIQADKRKKLILQLNGPARWEAWIETAAHSSEWIQVHFCICNWKPQILIKLLIVPKQRLITEEFISLQHGYSARASSALWKFLPDWSCNLSFTLVHIELPHFLDKCCKLGILLAIAAHNYVHSTPSSFF